jgi:two-component system, chemotaxis family, CheB/CheR fusion protein
MATVDNPGSKFLIVGIGASAGGLDALQRFLASLPADFDFALVFIQHLSAKHKSLLPELLGARRPSLVIQQISDGLKVQPGRLYLAPPGREVRLQNGLFQTTVHTEGLIHLPIDEFLSSLAENTGDHSIAVIFSGAGTDGARGCQAIRAAGGTVFVQDPQTAAFDSMPLAAIATGQADAMLSPEGIVAELLKLQGIGVPAVLREQPVTPEEYDGFSRMLQEKTGSRFHHYKKSVVSRRIKRRMYLHGLSSVKEYLDLISTSDAEAALLASDLMIGVTSFFRDRVAWKALNLEAVRKITPENADLPVRVWTPASSTGEEAYSIAMMLLRELELAGRKRDVQVFATDVNDRALERAREGKYPASITADVPQEYIQKYFTQTDNGNFLVINKDVRECVVFARQDLLTDPPFSKLDLIICRNFLIYLEPEAQEKSISLFHYALKEGGYLFLGNAETVGRKSPLFKSIGHKQCRVYRKLETKPASRMPISVPYATKRQQPSAKGPITEQSRTAMEIIQEKLLEEYGPAAVAIDQNYEIIYHNGPTNRYLCQPRGVPTQNLLELVPENLRSRIRGALYRSGREERPVVIRTSVAGDDNKTRHVTLRITRAADNLSIVVFQEKAGSSKKETAEQIDAAVIEETAIHQLESELSATRTDLQSHIEQLKSMNEEFQSSNEELQAANEELETSREELQSLNEELITVNSQLQGKIEEQDVTNNDLNNFLASTNIPTVFLDTHFRVKRFTPAMLKLIKLLPSDVGRPIVDMSQENLGPDLTSDAQAVLESLVPARQELELDGAWYVRTTLPYRTADNRIEGVVVTYSDVSDLKRSEERTRHLASFPELNPNPICEVHSSGKVTFCNPATGKILVTLGMDVEDLTAFLPEDMDGILRDLERKEEVSLYREKVIKDRVFGMTVHLAPQFNVVRIYAYDITERKQAEDKLRASEVQYRGLFENMVEGCAYCKMFFENGKPQDFIYLSVNRAFETLTGLKNVVGKRVSEVIPGIREADRELFEIYGRVSLTGKPERFEMFVEALKMWFSISVYSPEKEFFVAVFDVITERKKTEADNLKLSEDMTARNLELESLNKELESFIYSISHDLRAPIRTMSGFAKILHEDYAGKLDARAQDYLNRILRGSDKSTLLIDDLLRLSKVSRQELDRIDVNLSKKASKVIEDLREMKPGREVEVVVQEGLTAWVDPRLIELILSNLLGNAWKFTSKTENARIGFGALDSLVRISECGFRNETTIEQVKQGKTVYFIRDNGAGFDMTYADKMFWPFHRLHTDKEFEGTGIGLTIVERVIRRHGGKVWAEGEVGKGAVIYFTL